VTMPGSNREPISDRPHRRAVRTSLLAALALSLFGCLALGLAMAGTADAAKATAKPKATPTAQPTPEPTVAEPTMSPFITGRHVYDYGNIMSAKSVANAEALAAHIESAGGGKVIVETAADSSDVPDQATLVDGLGIDGMLLTGDKNTGDLTLGATLKGKLTPEQLGVVNQSSGPQTVESWITSTLARTDAFISGTHVFDGPGALDAAAHQKAEAAA
jgi:hypothetical protein